MDKHLYGIERHMRGSRALQVTRVMPSSIQKYLFIVQLKATLCPLSCRVACVGVGSLVWFVAGEPIFFFSHSFIEKYSLTFLVVGILTLILVTLILVFYFWFFFTIFYIFKKFKPALEITWFESLKFILRDVGGISSARHMIITIIIYLLVHLFSSLCTD